MSGPCVAGKGAAALGQLLPSRWVLAGLEQTGSQKPAWQVLSHLAGCPGVSARL